MATGISTDILIVGAGPAGLAASALLSMYGVENLVINKYGWLANTPRAHITNQGTMQVLRDLFHPDCDRRPRHWTGSADLRTRPPPSRSRSSPGALAGLRRASREAPRLPPVGSSAPP